MKSHLKVKVYTLAQEMSFIHRQEIKWKARAKAARQRQKQQADEKTAASILYHESNFWSLRGHRRDLKIEARISHLAYGFLKGHSYAKMEAVAYGKERGRVPPDWHAIEEMVARFTKDESSDPRDVMQRFSEWRAAAEAWYEGNSSRIKALRAVRADFKKAMANDPVYQEQRAESARLAKEQAMKAA